MRLYWLLLIIPFFVLSAMEARRNPAARADALNLGLSVYALIVCTILMIMTRGNRMMAGVIAFLFDAAGFVLNTSSRRVKGDRILRWQLKSAAESCFIFSVLFWIAFGFHLICMMGGA